MGRREPKIRFTRWGAINQDTMHIIASDVSLTPQYLRLWALALSRANCIGHAEFGPGELVEHMRGRPNNPDWQPSRQQVSRDIRRAVEKGLLAKGSSLRCLVLASDLWEKGAKGTFGCLHHRLKPSRKLREGRDAG